MIKWFPFLFCFLLFGTSGLAQTVINVDLTASPNITKSYSGYSRSGTDCGGTNCIIFDITLNPGSDLVNFNASQSTGASFYTIDCGALTPVGTPACISGKTQVRVSFCKVGGNDVTYTITASTSVKASDDLTVRAGCSAPFSVVGLDPATAVWTSVFPGAEGAYNSMLSCTSGCASINFTPGVTAPAYIDYRVSGTVSNCPNFRSDIVRVYVVPGMAVSFSAGNTVICSGAAATLSTNVSGGNSPYTYSWKKDGTPISNTTPSISVTEIGTYEVSVADNTNCTPVTQSIAVTAAPTPAAPTANGTAICAGSTATLTATATGGAYEWYDAIAGGNLLSSIATYVTPVLFSTKTYYVQTIANGCTSPRTPVMVTVNSIPDAPTVAGITICSGNTGTLTATAPGGSYEWYTDPSGGTPLPGTETFTTPVLSSTTTYYVQTTINGCTSPRSAVTVTVNPTPVAPTASGAAICNNTSTTLVATAPGGNYEWYDVASGGIPLIASSTFTTPLLTTTTTYYVQTTVAGCPSARTAVTVLVDAIPDSPTISGVVICSGTAATLTPTAPGGVYQWFSQASGGAALATSASFTTPILTASTTYYVQTVVNGCVSSRVPVTVTVNPIPAAPTAPGTTICSGNAAVLTATAPGGAYEWYSDPSGGTLLSSNDTFTTLALTVTTTYYVQTTINGCTGPRTSVTVTVIPTPVPPSAASPSICAGTTATLTATAPGGSYKWYDAAAAGNLLSPTANYTTPVLTTTTVYYVETTANGCTSARTPVTVTVNPLPAAPTVSGVTICSGNMTTLTATAPGGVYRWYSAAVSGTLLATNALYATPVLTTTTTYYVEAVSAQGCPGPRTSVTVTVIPEENADFSYSSGTYCITSTVDPIPTVVNPAGGTFSSTAGLSINSSTGEIDVSASTVGTYTITFVTHTTCVNSSSYNITITGAPDATFTYNGPYCQGQASPASPDFPAGASAGVFSSTAGLVFLNDLTGEIDLQASTPGTYAVRNTIAPIGGCASAIATSSVIINPTPTITSATTGIICSGTPQSYQMSSDVSGVSYTWSRAVVTGISNTAATAQTSATITEQLENTTLAPIEVVYLIRPSATGCDGPDFTYTVTVNPTPTVTSASTETLCDNIFQGYAITSNVSGTSYKWSRALVSGIDNPAVSAQTSDVITEQLDNTTNLPVDVIYSIVPSANGCEGPAFTYTVRVNPTPVVTSAQSATICNSISQSYTFTSNVGIATYTWSRAAVPGISNAPAPVQAGAAITETLVNTTALPVPVVYQVTASAYGCDGPVFTYTVMVNPTPVVTGASSETLCNNMTQSYAFTSNVAVATYTWSRTAVAGISNTAVPAQAGTAITETLVNTTDLPISVAYQITASAYGCDGPVFTYMVTVNPSPVVTSAATASICSNTSQNYTITGNVGTATYTWSRAAVSGISNTAISNQAGPISEALTNTTSLPVEVVYAIYPKAYGCDGPIFNYKVTVNPTPVVTSLPGLTICNSTAQSYTFTSNVGVTTYTWSRAVVPGISNGSVIAQAGTSITETLINTSNLPVNVIYSIVPSAYGCNGPAFTYTVKVNPTPTVTSQSDLTICNNITQNYTITSNLANSTYSWSRASVTGIDNGAVTAQTSDVITETLVNATNLPVDVIYSIVPSANGCDGPAFTYTVKVNPTPLITSAQSATICNNTDQNYTFTSNVGMATYTWSRAAVAGISNAPAPVQAGTAITEKLVNTTTLPIAVVYQITASAYGCNGPVFLYTVTVNPTPLVTSISNIVICNKVAQNYTITSDVAVATYTWSRAAVTGISNIQVTAQTSAVITEQLENTTSLPVDVIYNIVPSAYGCDGPVFTYTVTVNPSPVVTSAATASICSNTSQNYTITGNVGIATYTWSRAAVSGISNTAISNQAGPVISETLINTTSSPITVAYDITPFAYGCTGPVFNYTVTVNPIPVVTSAATAVICNQTTQNYQMSSDVSGTSYTWSRAVVPGISNVAVIAQTGAAITETLINTSSLPVNVTYNIVPSAYGCSGPAFSYTITVNPTPQITSTANATICNNTVQNYTITSNVSGAGFTWNRAMVAGISNLPATAQTSNVIAETLINTTSASIDVTYRIMAVAYACEGPVFTYTVRVDPSAVITSSASSTTCNNTAQNYTITSNVSGTTFTWSRATVTGISNPSATAQSGNITETLVNTSDLPLIVPYQIIPAINGCNGTAFTYNLTVNPTPRITNTSLNQVVCSTSSSTAVVPQSNVVGTNFSWTAAASAGVTGFIASGTGTIPAQTLHNALPGSGTITYTIRSFFAGCMGVAANYVITVLNQVPVTPLVTNSSPVCVGKSLILSTQQVSGATYSWTGPNGFTSTSRTPSINNVTADNEGVYTVIITVGQCAASATTTVIVNRPAIVAAGNDQTVCANNAVIEISGTVSGGSTTGTWTSSGSGSFPMGTGTLNGTYVPSDADKATGEVILTLTATNTASCEATASSFRLSITPVPVISAGEDRMICAYEPLVLTGQSTAANIKWTSSGSGTFLPGNTSLNANYMPSINDKIKGSVTITLSTTGPSNCIPVTDQINLVIVPAPTLELGDDVYVFEGESKVLSPVEITGTNLQYLWMPNINLNDNTLRNPTFTGSRDTRYTLTVTGTAGCKVVDRFFVKVLKSVVIPNAFSPNGDGINDTWTPQEIDNYPGAVISIFNRYGTRLYNGHAKDIAWDGTYNGSQLPVGVYYYLLDLNGYGKSISGSVTIIR